MEDGREKECTSDKAHALPTIPQMRKLGLLGTPSLGTISFGVESKFGPWNWLSCATVKRFDFFW